jgi:hypothetical protein
MFIAQAMCFVPGAIAALVLTRIAGRLDLFANVVADEYISFVTKPVNKTSK